MVKMPNGVADSAATPADAAARPAKANPSTPGSAKPSKFKKRKLVKVIREKPAVAAAAVDEVASVGAGTGDGDASASVVSPQPSSVAEAAPVAQTQPSDAAEASPVVQTQPSDAAEASPVVQTQPSIAAEASPVVQTQPSSVAEASPVVQTQPSNAAEESPVVQTPKSTPFAEASAVAQTQKPAADGEGSVPAPVPATAEASASLPKPKPKPKPKAARANAAISGSKGKPVTAISGNKGKPATAISASKGKPATGAEGSVPAPKLATAEASASSPKPKPKPADANADAAAAISASKGKRKGDGEGKGAENSGGDGRLKRRRGRRGAKGKEVVEDGGSKEKGKVKKSVGKKDERGDRKVAGFIFMCNAKTKKECYQNRLFGMPSGKIEMVKKIRPGVKLFLYDFDLKLLYGVYKAASHGGLNLVQEAFNGKFPAQVKFKIDTDCRPLPESSLKQAIKENYSARSKFDPELTARQVQRLLVLFKPVSAPQSVPNNHREERRHYGERRKPYHHFEERRRSLPIEEARQPRFDEERRPRHVPLDDPYRAPRFAAVPVESQLGHSLASVQGDHHRYYQPPALVPEPRHIPLALEPRYVPVATIPELRHVPAAYYRTLAPSGDSYYRSVENLVPERYADRTLADITTRDPIIRDYTALPGEAYARPDRLDDLYQTRSAHVEELYRPGETAARADRVGITTRADRVEELYRSDRLVSRAVDPPHSTYLTTAYETNPVYAETGIRPVSARVSGPGAPVSSHYSFTGGPVYR